MFRHVKDKFGNSLLLQRTPLTTLSDVKEHVDVGNKRLRFVADPEEEHDSVNRRYLEEWYVKRKKHNELLHRVETLEQEKLAYVDVERFEGLVSRVCKLEKAKQTCLQLNKDGTMWDAGNRRITNVVAGESNGDASTFEQSLTYDEKSKNFRAGDKYFKLTETSADKPVITAMVNEHKDIVYVGYGTDIEVPNTKLIRWNPRRKVAYDADEEIVWDEVTKRFAYRKDTSWAKLFPLLNIKSKPRAFPLPLPEVNVKKEQMSE